MKNKHITIITLCAVCAVALVIGMIVPVSGVTGEKFLSDVRQSYRSASLVVSGICEDTLAGADGSIVSRVRVDEVIAGNAEKGELLQIKDQLEQGNEYLLYLSNGDEVHFAEDQHRYVSVSAEPFIIVGDNVEYGGSAHSLEDIIEDMAEMDKTVTAHGAVYSYDDINALKEASESIFIGRVMSVSPLKNTRFRSQEGGSTVEKTAPASAVTITVYGSVKGALGYGSSVQLMYVPQSVGGMTDGATLEPVSRSEEDIIELTEGDTYLFFLADDPDAKQDYSFPVNPIQGWVKVDNDVLTASDANVALAGYDTLPQLISDMRK